MSVFPDSINKAEKENKDANKTYLKAGDLLVGTWIVGKVEIMNALNPKFGAQPTDGLFKREILKEGQTLRYNLTNEEGEHKIFESKGTAFFIGFRNAQLEEGDRVAITKEGTGESTRYSVKTIE